MKCFVHIFLLIVLLMLSACSATKHVPEGYYLLDEVRIETDNRDIRPSDLSMYVRQHPKCPNPNRCILFDIFLSEPYLLPFVLQYKNMEYI